MTTKKLFLQPRRLLHAAAALFIGSGCATPPVVPPAPVRVVGADTVPIPINELGRRTYKGLQGGLFPGVSNAEPADHDALGLAHRNLVRRLGVNGVENALGRIVLLSVGSTAVSSAWCSASSAPPCNSWSFTGRAVADPSVNHGGLVIVNGAFPNAAIGMWSTTAAQNYDRIRDTRLAPLGLSENQVQVIWMSIADSGAVFSLTASPDDASAQLQRYGRTIRALKQRYPNLTLLFLSNGIFSDFSPGIEATPYESAFVVRWVIESQIEKSRAKPTNPDVGDLTPSGSIAPWISWGPYLWTAGRLTPADEAKLGGLLLEFFKSSAYTKCWFLAAQGCG